MLMKSYLVILTVGFLCFIETVWMKKSSTHFHFMDNLFYQVKHLQEKYINPYVEFEKIEFLNKIHTQAFLSTVLISLVPFALLGFLPKSSCHTGSKTMRFLLGFAIGSLLGDSLLHLIPHSMEPSHDKHQNKFIKVAYPLMGGLLTFYIIESLIRLTKHRIHQNAIGKQKKKDSESASTSATEPVVGTSKKNKTTKPKTPATSFDVKDISTDSTTPKKKRSKNKSYGSTNTTLSTAAFLNFMTDFTHNLLDGMAISAAYQNSFKLGLATTISVLIHEIPHEISDFAILIKVGYSKWKAAFIQLFTATGALIGTYLGLYLSQRGAHNQSPPWILSFIAGGFIYISCVCVAPEMLHESNPGLMKLFLEVLGMICGVSLMEIFTAVHLH